MQRLLFLWAVLALGIVAIGSSNPGCLFAQDLILQESFESGDGVPENWNKGAAIPGVSYIYDKSNASDGSRSLGFKKTDRGVIPIAQWFRKIEYGGDAQTLELSAMVKARGVTKAIVELQFYNLAQEMISKECVIYIGQKEKSDRVASHDWKRYSGQVSVPEETKQIVVALQMYGPGTVSFDEIKLGVASDGNEAPANNRSPDPNATRSPSVMAKPTTIRTDAGAYARYLLVPPSGVGRAPSNGHPLILVLAGGDGSEEAFPFVQSIHKQTLKGKYAVAQIVAPPIVVWPTRYSPATFATTEDSIEAIIDAINEELPIDRSKIVAIAWSSSGPATYASMLSEKTPLKGALIAMSSFYEEDYPQLSKISGRRFYLLHSPKDELTPYRMSQEARDKLLQAGNVVQLKDYVGGHGWHGKSVSMIPEAVDWLLKDD